MENIRLLKNPFREDSSILIQGFSQKLKKNTGVTCITEINYKLSH